MEVCCFVNQCFQPPYLACDCNGSLTICCVQHYGFHASDNIDIPHSPMKLEKRVKDTDKQIFLDQLQKLLSNENSIKSNVLKIVQEINSESEKIISNSIKNCKIIKKMIKDIKSKGLIVALMNKDLMLGC
jgi:hypothetical protein